MTWKFLPPGSRELHEKNSTLSRVFAQNSLKVDQLRDHRKTETECIDWSSSGEKILVVSRDGTMKLWRSDRLLEERSWAGSWTWAEAHPSDPHLFAAVSWEGKLRVTDIRTPSIAAIEVDLKKSKGIEKLLHVTWRPDGSEVALVTRTDSVHTVDVSGGAITGTAQPGSEVYSVMYDSWNRLWAAVGGTPGKLFVYPDNSFNEPDMLVAHAHSTSCLSRSGDVIVSGGSDGLVAIWDSTKMKCLRTLPDSISPVTTVSCSDSTNSLVAWGSGGSGVKDGESVLSIGGLQTGQHYVSHNVPAPVSRVKWHPSKLVLAYSLQAAPGVETGVSLMSFPSLD